GGLRDGIDFLAAAGFVFAVTTRLRITDDAVNDLIGDDSTRTLGKGQRQHLVNIFGADVNRFVNLGLLVTTQGAEVFSAIVGDQGTFQHHGLREGIEAARIIARAEMHLYISGAAVAGQFKEFARRVTGVAPHKLYGRAFGSALDAAYFDKRTVVVRVG